MQLVGRTSPESMGIIRNIKIGLWEPTNLKIWSLNNCESEILGCDPFFWLVPRPIFLHMNIQTQPNNLIIFFLWRFVLCDAQKNTRTVLEHSESDLLEWCFFFRAKLQDLLPSSFSQENIVSCCARRLLCAHPKQEGQLRFLLLLLHCLRTLPILLSPKQQPK